ncbi:MAG: hypothetical protein RTU92_09110 [Candidatus Thorarchaeota archaeon]
MNERSKKAVTLVMITISIASYGIFFNLPPVTEYDGWLIRQYDEVQYSVTAEIHAGDTFVADILNEYGIASGSSFRIRAAETPSILNISGISENLLEFTGVVPVEQQLGQDWVLRNSSLPFFLPTGYWDEIDEALNQTVGIDLVEEWWGDMTITTSIDSTELGVLDYFLAWEREDGVLQGMTINATSHDGWDFIRLALSSQRLAYQTDIDYLLQSVNRNVPVLILLFGTFGSFFVLSFLWRSEIQKRLQKPLPGSLEDRLEEYSSVYLLLWTTGLLITAITSLWASQFTPESIVPVIGSYCFAILLSSFVSFYRLRNIEWNSKPVELIQYGFVSMAAFVSGLFIFQSGEVTTPLAYALPLVFILGALVPLVVMYPLRRLSLTTQSEIVERDESSSMMENEDG